MTIEELKKLGVNTDEGLERCLNDEEFYLSLVPDALSRERYEQLEELINNKDMKAAFEASHALKGILANLSLTPLYETVSEITELLRAHRDEDYSELIDKMWQVYKGFEEIMR